METISFESLKKKIKNNVRSPKWIAMQRPGEYTLDRMAQILGMQETVGAEDLVKQIHTIIDRVDVRCVDRLILFCKEFSIVLPAWILNGAYRVDLTDLGWSISKD